MLYFCLFICFIFIFLFGITRLRIGLLNLSEKKIELWLKRFTKTPFIGMVFGMLMTALLQSSSAVMVITVGLVGARILSFPQTIGIILGTNIGTTFTLEFLSFHLSSLCIPFLLIGIIFHLFRDVRMKSISYIFLGLALIFAAMRGFEWLAIPLTQMNFVHFLFTLLHSHLFLALLFGMVLAASIQSSTVTIGMAMSFISAGVFPIETGIAIMLGANIGTCFTGLLASFGAGEEARLTAYAHIWLNVGGALVFYPFITLLAHGCKLLTVLPEQQLAHASLLFNVGCSLLVLPFAEKFGKFIMILHGKKS
ncbi:Na/Pi symporter [Heyndrickxia ginsengihumi]|uniref:Na/Pi symporter n=1 Tax=Heyndrickxia ginsengihumi TaxID=363870 RepID=UPI00046E8B5D|nr:Na/Pi symporter [Heyndrickxia ginsengihumi]MBE6183969.1 Na/Pi cotransporter family protein [Bacillus sp. (in: firmicutes)]MCM3021775.1 Na/Pi symporter [Heyndrickxia ginsengihumi]